MPKRDNYLSQLQRRREAAQDKPRTGQKPVEQMTPEELDAELKRLEAEHRRAAEDAVRAGRESVSSRPRLFPRARRYWK